MRLDAGDTTGHCQAGQRPGVEACRQTSSILAAFVSTKLEADPCCAVLCAVPLQVHLAMALRRRESYMDSQAATIKLTCNYRVRRGATSHRPHSLYSLVLLL